ncbi:uncharacterized protein [Narcine bancroftii]|uniref:uncharacterized protein isoform X4 n=1 Tax=Narcine bancroftii TaxID=1343680 RepID=UPI00383197B3
MVWNFPESTSDLIDRPAKEYYDDVDDVHSIMKESNNPLQKLVREFYDDINSINDGLPKTGSEKKGNTPDYENIPECSSAVGEKKGQLTESTVHPLQKPGKEYYDDIDVIGSVKEGLPKTGNAKKGNTPDYKNVPESSSAVGEKKGQLTESTVHPLQKPGKEYYDDIDVIGSVKEESTVHPLQKPGKEYYDDIDVIGSVKEGLPKTGTSQRGSTSSYENVPECTSAIREKKLQVAGLPKTGNEKRGITSDYENVPECSSALGEKKWQLTGHILKPDP